MSKYKEKKSSRERKKGSIRFCSPGHYNNADVSCMILRKAGSVMDEHG